tara:strand:+ start:433 stop:1203 length:771 start_codon:yes stop_codon:yes gene_type:complete
MSLYKIPFVLLLSLSSVHASEMDKPKGWLWYQDPVLPKEKVEDPLEKKESSPSVSQKPLSATERLEEQKKAFEEAKALAILEPTLENVANAQRHHNFIMDQASDFQKSWTTAELINPGYEKIVTSPGSLKIREEQDEASLSNDLKILSKEFGLIFAFKPDCPYCHQFAPLVKQFAVEHGFDVQALSKGDECFEGMTCSKNESALLAVNPKLEFPMLYLANPKTNEVIPIAHGYIGLDALMTNIKYVISYLKNKGQF